MISNNTVINLKKEEILKKLVSHYKEWILLLDVLEKEEKILHKEFTEVIDLAKMQNLVEKIKD